MAKPGDPSELVTLQELAVLERKGILTQHEVLEKIQRQRHKKAQ